MKDLPQLGSVMVFIIIWTVTVCSQTGVRYEVNLIKPKPSSTLEYEDLAVRINFILSSQLVFKLQNKSNDVIEIDWNRASLVDTEGGAHKVIHEGVRYIERDKALPATVIPPGANVTDIAHPADYISYNSAQIKWETKDLLPGSLSQYAGKRFSLLLPIKIKGVIKNYFFTFRIDREAPAVTAARLKKLEVKSSLLKKIKVSKQDFGDEWPFTVNEGTLACSGEYPSIAVFFIANTTTYALNGWAEGKNIDGVPVSNEISVLKTPAATITGQKALMPLVNRALKTCE